MQYRALTGIDFDGVGDEPGVRVEAGELLPPISNQQVHDLREAGAIEQAPDAEPAEKPAPAKKGRK